MNLKQIMGVAKNILRLCDFFVSTTI